MAIHYYSNFSKDMGSRNFGDDINPYLLGKLLDPSILAREDLCVFGIGTILNRRNFELVSHYPSKVIFSSGAGYGQFSQNLGDDWDVVCVRGPGTAECMGLDSHKAVCDGAILLSRFFEPVPKELRSGVVFIPHLNTHFSAGKPLEAVCSQLGWYYLTPDRPKEEFVDRVRSARLVITEAMHGAILSDTMRVPWIPIALHEHHDFKWRDWFRSIEEEYASYGVSPAIWNAPADSLKARLKRPYQSWKIRRLKKDLESLLGRPAVLSSDGVIESKMEQLDRCLSYINNRYSL